MKRASIFVTLFMLSLASLQAQLDRISVSGNSFVDPSGKEIVFRGYSSSDPDKLESQGDWNQEYFEEMKRWGANLVRFPIHPTAWNKRGKEAYLKLLDDGIKWAGDQGMYVIIDWHSIGNLRTEMYQDDMYKHHSKRNLRFLANHRGQIWKKSGSGLLRIVQ